jgi:GNAT superfamily N-acetyltransferase
MLIRKAQKKDLKTVVGMAVLLVGSVVGEHIHHPRYAKYLKKKPFYKEMLNTYFLKKLRSRDAIIHVAEKNNEIAAYCLSYISKEVPIYVIDITGYISDLYVMPKFRGQGISTMLKDAAFAWFRKKGIAHASIKTYFLNDRARSIYLHWGFFEYSVNLRKNI